MDSGMSNILNSGFMPYTTAASLEMSDEPLFLRSRPMFCCRTQDNFRLPMDIRTSDR